MNELITIVELEDFRKFVKKHLSETEYDDLITFLAANPTEGDLIQGSGGVRKLRWAIKGKGKSGGARIIYYHYNETKPLFAISGFVKSEMDNITTAEKNEIRKLLDTLIEDY